MKLYKILNFVIVVLVIAAIYQTGELWLAETSGRSFFSVLAAGATNTGAETEGEILLATRYAIGEGEGNFSVYYPEQTGTGEMLGAANDVMDEILSDSDMTTERITVDWKEILSGRCIVLQYDFMVSTEEYLSQYRRARENESLEYFDYITLIPSRRPGEETKVYFVNSETNESICYTTMKSQSASELYTRLTADPERMTYISTGQKTSSSVLWRNLFLPQWASLPYAYSGLEQEAVFEQGDAVNRGALEDAVKGFFANFSVDWSNREETGSYVFSDSQTVVKYLPEERVLEYYSYESYGNENSSTGLLDGYQISCNFLMNDSTLTTGVYLSDLDMKSNETVYYFDYVVDQLPVELSAAVQERIGSRHAIEVTVRGDSVKRYRRYAVNYNTTGRQDLQVNVQFIDALDDANKTYQTTVEERVITEVRNVSLGYYVPVEGDIELKWFVTLYDYLFVIETDSAEDTEEQT